MSNQAAQGGQGGDNAYAPLWIMAGLIIVAVVAWYLGHVYIVYALAKVKMAEAWLIAIFDSNALPIVDRLHAVAAHPETVQPKDLVSIADIFGYAKYLSYFFAAGMGVFAMILFANDNTKEFTHVYDIRSLRNFEKVLWPQICPVAKLDLISEDVTKGPWAMGDTPLEFAKKSGLLNFERNRKEGELGNKVKITATLKRTEAFDVFSAQMGPLWKSIDDCPIYIRALFAAFAARGAHDAGSAAKLLKQISRSTEGGELNFAGVDALLAKYAGKSAVKKILGTHAYQLTMMASMLELARKEGVLATSDFIWLKPINRRLWYMLNNVGRQTCYSEIAGPWAHWLIEKALGRPLLIPMIEEAVNGLDIAIQSIIYVPTEEELASGKF